MTTATRRASSLSPPQRKLLKILHQLNFGRLERLNVCGGQPVLEPPPRIVREHKFGGENGPRNELCLDDFTLKAQVVELFDEFERLGDGVVDVLIVKHGLPFTMHVNMAAGAH